MWNLKKKKTENKGTYLQNRVTEFKNKLKVCLFFYQRRKNKVFTKEKCSGEG